MKFEWKIQAIYSKKILLNEDISYHVGADSFIFNVLTHKQLKTHGCTLSIEAIDALLLKHQAISFFIAGQISIAVA